MSSNSNRFDRFQNRIFMGFGFFCELFFYFGLHLCKTLQDSRAVCIPNVYVVSSVLSYSAVKEKKRIERLCLPSEKKGDD